MKDTNNREDTRRRQKKRRGRDAPDSSPGSPMESYTPAQRRTVRKGLRILAKVAVRAHMRRSAGWLAPEDDSGGQRDGLSNDSEERPSGI